MMYQSNAQNFVHITKTFTSNTHTHTHKLYHMVCQFNTQFCVHNDPITWIMSKRDSLTTKYLTKLRLQLIIT